MTQIPTATLSRALDYLRVLEQLEQQAASRVSSSELALAIGSSPAQVRKDLASLGRFGRRGQGYSVALLKRELLQVTGLNRKVNVVMLGMGSMGRALAEYTALSENHFQIVGLFDPNRQAIGQTFGPLEVQSLEQLPVLAQYYREQGQPIELGLITSGSEEAQRLANMLVNAGIPGILNFAPTTIQLTGNPQVAGGQIVENIDLIAGMKKIAYHLFQQNSEQYHLEEVI